MDVLVRAASELIEKEDGGGGRGVAPGGGTASTPLPWRVGGLSRRGRGRGEDPSGEGVGWSGGGGSIQGHLAHGLFSDRA